MPEEMRSYRSYCTSRRGVGRVELKRKALCAFFAGAGETVSSMRELNFPHSGQRPSHLGETYPHSLHTNCVVVFGIVFPFLGVIFGWMGLSGVGRPRERIFFSLAAPVGASKCLIPWLLL